MLGEIHFIQRRNGFKYQVYTHRRLILNEYMIFFNLCTHLPLDIYHIHIFQYFKWKLVLRYSRVKILNSSALSRKHFIIIYVSILEVLTYIAAAFGNVIISVTNQVIIFKIYLIVLIQIKESSDWSRESLARANNVVSSRH